MNTNDCLRRLRYILDFDDTKMVAVFAEAEQQVDRSQLSNWLKKDDDPEYQECSDLMLATFLNGLINIIRGKKDGAQPVPEQRLNNNIIFRKLKIAFDLQAEDILNLLSLVDCQLSKHELSAFFRREDHKHYRECKDQVLRKFLNGLQIEYRGDSELKH